MAGLPDIKLSDAEPGYSIAALREQLQAEIGRRDERLLYFLFLRHDCQNLVQLLKDPEAELQTFGNYNREQLQELIDRAAEVDLGKTDYPQFLIDFVRQYGERFGELGWYAEDEVLMLYYNYCTAHCKDPLMRRWYQLNYDVTNVLTAMIARRQGWKVADFVMGNGEVQEAIRTSDTSDFGLSAQLPYFAQLMNIVNEEDPVRKERMLDALKWEWLEEETFADTFSIEAVFAYLCKLEIQERWARLDVEQGRETFEKIIHDLRGEAQVPDEFLR